MKFYRSESKPTFDRQKIETALIILIGVFLALLLRYVLRGYVSYDYTFFIGDWYHQIKRQGLASFGKTFSNYTPFYIYLLWGVSVVFRRLSGVTAVKLPSIAFDFVGAWLMARLVRLKYPKGPVPILAFFAVLFAPTVFVNSSLWGQSDIIFTTFLLAFLYFVLVRRPALGMLMFGVAFAIKFQTIFLAPFLLALLLRRVIPWRWLLLIPLVYLVTLIPALVAGRPLVELLTVYAGQVDLYKELTLNAPNLYTWLSDTYAAQLYPGGLVLTVAASFAYAIAVFKSREPLTPGLLIELALISAILVPYVLPKMHERYFYLADVLAILFAFYFPRYFLVPILMNLFSFYAYAIYLFGREPIPLPQLAILLLGLLVFLCWDALRRLYGNLTPQTPSLQEKGEQENVLLPGSQPLDGEQASAFLPPSQGENGVQKSVPLPPSRFGKGGRGG